MDEGVGSFELCVQIFNDPSFFPTHTNITFFLHLVSMPGTAGKLTTYQNAVPTVTYFLSIDGSDYVELTPSNNPLGPFTADPSTHRQCFNVTIINDEALEDTERFNLNLTLAGGSTVPVVVDPDISEVEISDEDGLFRAYIFLTIP